MITRIQITGRGSPRRWVTTVAWGCTWLVASGMAHAQNPLAAETSWTQAERPAAMVVVQPPRSSVVRMQTVQQPAGSAAVQLAPLPPTAEEVPPLPAGPQSPPANSQTLRRPAKRSLPSDFRSIGELTASSQIGTSNAQADVTAADRPSESLPEQDPIAIASDRNWSPWSPASPMQSVSVHQPLYFEDTNLERYGTSSRPRLQPIGSAAHFLATAVSLPYQMTLQRPEQPYQYSHPFEAGRYGHRERVHPPCDRRAALVQASVIVGLVFFLP